jgi:hypothetical protein
LRVLRIDSTADTHEEHVPVPLKRSTGTVELPETEFEVALDGLVAELVVDGLGAEGALDGLAASAVANATLVVGGFEKDEEPHPVRMRGVMTVKAMPTTSRNALAEGKCKRTKPP